MTQGTPPPPAPVGSSDDGSSSPTYRVTLPEFEGPLDLLLHLCETHEIDILNISVSFVAEKYVEYLELMQDMAVEVAADYLVMAAHLAYLKSRELVPSPEPLEVAEDGEEPIDPRQELIRRLLEYQKYKHAAESLGSRPIEGRNVFVRGATLEPEGDPGFAEHSVWKLLEHWADTLRQAKPQYTHDVVVDRVSITDRINHVVDLLEAGKGMVRFEDLLGQHVAAADLRHQVVVSLLAVLELARLRVIRILQQESTGAFFLAQVDGAVLSDARRLNVTSVKETAPSSAADPAAATEASGTEQPEQPVGTEAPPAAETSGTAAETSGATAGTEAADTEARAVAAAEASGTEQPAATEAPPADPVAAVETTAPDIATSTEAVGLRPQEEVVSPPSPAPMGEEATDGQEEQKETQE